MDLRLFSNDAKMPVILQNEIAECGLASVAMCFAKLGLDIPLTLLRKKYQFGSSGMSMADISTVCENEGMVGDAYELEIKHLPELPLPAILHWGLNHFVVLESVGKKSIVIHDPAIGKRVVSMDEVSKQFSGYAVSVERGQHDEFQASKTSWETKKKQIIPPLSFSGIFKKSHGLGKGLLYLVTLTAICQIMVMAIPLITQTVVDDFIAVGENSHLYQLMIGGAGLMLFLFVVRMMRGWMSIVVGYHWHKGFSSYFFQRLVRLPMSFFESRNISDVNTKFRVLDKLKDSFTEGVVNGIIDGLMSIFTLAIMFIYMPVLAAISLLFFLIYMVVRLYFIKGEVAASVDFFNEHVKEFNVFFETISNMLSIKIYGKEGSRYQQWKVFYLRKMNAMIALMKMSLWYVSANELLGYVERLLILYVGAIAVINQEITLGMMFAFFAYREIFSTQSKSLLDNVMEFRLLKVDLEKLSDIEEESVEAHMLGENSVKTPIKGKVDVVDLCFSFVGSEKPLFDKFNFSVEQGEHVVITGPSGTGKTTLMRLLAGVVQPNAGRIVIDNKPLNSIGHQHYRKYVGIINQQERLISGTILDNIAFSDEKLDKNKVIMAAKRAHVYDEIMATPMQFNTVVAGSHASMLSGGQVQRILIARALYAMPKILFMDEATSALDPVMEKKVNETLSSLDITRISIAHRKETIEIADREIKLCVSSSV